MAPEDGASLTTKASLSSRNLNPLQRAIVRFASTVRSNDSELVLNQRDIPKRYTCYGSLLLLGPTFLTHSPTWEIWFNSLKDEQQTTLFKSIAETFPAKVTHVAANAPITSTKTNTVDETDCDPQIVNNVMRSPTNFLPLHGEFGPCEILNNGTSPSSQDFDQAYWTETVQLNNIMQVWAPRWTMFSRGNISEKARILQIGSRSSTFPGLSTEELGEHITCTDVVDFYVGIGYFAFCYLSRGVRRVWGWDINGWSIEGLRRGCHRNRWNVKVVRITEDGKFEDPTGAEGLVHEIVMSDRTENSIRCVAIWGNNTWVTKIMNEIAEAFLVHETATRLNIRHCNLGLLPTSIQSWHGALSVLSPRGGWLHVHENAEINGIDQKARDVVRQLQDKMSELHSSEWHVVCEHVEQVKTYAPGIMHCVFDTKVMPSISLS